MDMDQLHNFDDEKEDKVMLPPGFRFHSEDEEIIELYLRGKVENQSFQATAINEIDICKNNPWDLLTMHQRFAELRRLQKERYLKKYKNNISLKSSDNVVFEMDIIAATSESGVLRDLIDSTGGLDEIPMPKASHSILSGVIEFCKKNHKLQKRVDSAVRLLKSVLDPYKVWLTGFLRNNKPILSDLQEAADYLNIPSLLEFTSVVMGDMMENTVEEISEWWGRSSILRRLSPLGIIGV